MGEENTKKKQFLTICVINIFVLLPIIGQTSYAENTTESKTILPDYIKDSIRGIKIDFRPPAVIQNSGSYFLLNVSLTRMRILPLIFSIVVYMKLPDEYGRDHAVRIGSIPYVFFPAHNNTMTLSIPCLTQHGLASDVACLFSGRTSNCSYLDGEIGVRIYRVGRWIINDFFWRTFIIDKLETEDYSKWADDQPMQFLSFLELISSMSKNSGVILKFHLLSALTEVISHKIARDKMIVWHQTQILPSFMSSAAVSMDAAIANKTDKHGGFNVTVNIKNNLNLLNLNTTVKALVLVDMSDRSFVNSIIPSFKGITIYNCGYWLGSITNTSNSIQINCTFPDKGFDHKNYDIVVECAPFIDVGNTNIYSIYFYTIRWQTLIKPYYVIDEIGTKYVRELWSNTPIYYGEPIVSGQIFQTNNSSILYTGETLVDKLMNEVTQNFFDQPLLILLLVFLVGTPYTLMILLIYRNIRNVNRKSIRKKNR